MPRPGLRREEVSALARLLHVVARLGEALRVRLEVPAGGASATLDAARARARARGAAERRQDRLELGGEPLERLRVLGLGDLLRLVEVGDGDVEGDRAGPARPLVDEAQRQDQAAHDLVLRARVDLDPRVFDRLGGLALLLLREPLRELLPL